MSNEVGKPAADRASFKEVALKPLADQVHDLELRQREPGVHDLAESIAKWGHIHPPVVSSKTRKLISGRDRVAAAAMLGRRSIVVKVVRCTAEEAAAIEREENLRRRTAPRERTAISLDAVAQLEEKGLSTKEAMAEVAGARGIHPDTLRKGRDRGKKRKKTKRNIQDVPAEERAKSTIETYGIELQPNFLRGVHMVQYRYQVALDAIKTARGPLRTLLRQHPDIIHRGTVERLEQDLLAVATAIQSATPKALCPYCKGIEIVQKECQVCLGTGYVGRGKITQAPPELVDMTVPRVSYHGRIVEISKLEDEEPI